MFKTALLWIFSLNTKILALIFFLMSSIRANMFNEHLHLNAPPVPPVTQLASGQAKYMLAYFHCITGSFLCF